MTKEQSDMNLELAALSKEELDARLDAINESQTALLNELERRKSVERMERLEKLRVLLKPEIIDAMFPTHDRITCSDTHPINGFNGGRVRCSRCVFLEALHYGNFDASYEMGFSLNVVELYK